MGESETTKSACEHGASLIESLLLALILSVACSVVLPFFAMTLEDEVKVVSCAVGGGTQTSDPSGGGDSRIAPTLVEQCKERVRLERLRRQRDDRSSSGPPGPG